MSLWMVLGDMYGQYQETALEKRICISRLALIAMFLFWEHRY
jgi:hypothetical protein